MWKSGDLTAQLPRIGFSKKKTVHETMGNLTVDGISLCWTVSTFYEEKIQVDPPEG